LRVWLRARDIHWNEFHLQAVDAAVSGDSIHTSPQSSAKSKRMLPFNRRHSHRSQGSHKTSVSSGDKPSLDRPSLDRPVVHPNESVSVENFPGGDAMLEALTRLQSLQDNFYLQLQVITAPAWCCDCIHSPLYSVRRPIPRRLAYLLMIG
jgi:hypothetical protein